MINKQFAMADQYSQWLFRRLSMAITMLSLSLSPIAIVSAAALQSIDYNSSSADEVEITATFSESIDEPNSFSIDDPARIVLDFGGVQSELGKSPQVINMGVTRSVSAVEVGDRTRIIVNLLQGTPYSIEHDDNIVKLVIENQIITSDYGTREVTGIDFNRSDNNEAKLTISVSDDGAVLDVNQDKNNIIVNLIGTSLPEHLRRRLDVIDFETPVQMIDSDQIGDSTQLILSAKGQFEHSAYQSDNILVIEVKPISQQSQTTGQEDRFGYKGEKLSLNFQNIEVRAVLMLLADFTGLNLVTSDTVQGNITLRLKNVPWDQAMDIILKTKGLAMRKKGSIMLVAPASEIAAQERQELESQKQLAELEPLYSELFRINFAKAEDLAAIITKQHNSSGAQSESASNEITGFISGRGSVTVDTRTNSLLIRDTAVQLAEVKKLIESLDIAIRQVLIKSRIVVANDDFAKDLGVRLGGRAKRVRSGSTGYLGGSLNANRTVYNNDIDIAKGGEGDKNIGSEDSLNISMPVTKAGAGRFAMTIVRTPFQFLELELSALQTEGKGEVVSSPHVITSDQQTASIKQGVEIPYQEATSSGATSTSFKEATLKLEVTPQITPDDHLVLDLKINKDSVGAVVNNVPSINKQEVETQVIVNNGETVVLGGIFEKEDSSNVKKIPWLGDLPYLGRVFKSSVKVNDKKEVLVFVTPQIVEESLNNL